MLKIGAKFYILVIGLVLRLTVNLSAKNFDVENWTFVGGETTIGKTMLSFHNANFFRHDEVGYFLNHTQIALEFPLLSNWNFGVGYKQEYVKFPTRWRAEYRPMLELFYMKKWKNLSFRDRSRWEFRIMDGEFVNRYRNQIQFAYTRFEKITPYLSTEFSFYFNKLDYTRQRTILGALIPVKKVNLNLFLGHQLNEDRLNEWGTKIMLGTGLNYQF